MPTLPPSLTLLAEAAVCHAPTRSLIVADVHLGKAAAFRANGIPVPEGDDSHDLTRLAQLVEKHAAARLVIAGDLFHAPSGITPALLERLESFLATIAIPLHLTLGNHDAKLRTLPPGITTTPHLDLTDGDAALRVIHDPADATPGGFHIAGHIHPVVRIREGRRTALRLPCFWLQENRLVLPSFGTFTGGSIISPAPGDAIFTALRGQIVEIPSAAWR